MDERYQQMMDAMPRKVDLTTFEIAKLLSKSPRTIARMIDDGEFGPEGTAWFWTKAGRGRGSRKVRAKYVRDWLKRNA